MREFNKRGVELVSQTVKNRIKKIVSRRYRR